MDRICDDKKKAAKHATILFDVNSLCLYPRPEHVVYDNGSKMIGCEFQEMLKNYSITSGELSHQMTSLNAQKSTQKYHHQMHQFSQRH